MEVVTRPHIIAPGSVAATIGMFDGLHRGHAMLIEYLNRQAHSRGLKSAVITFREHPQKVLRPDTDLQMIMTIDDRIEAIRQHGADYVILMDFDLQLARLDSFNYIKLIRDNYGVKLLVTGFNHRFGHNKEGDFHRLHTLYEETGIEVREVGRCDIGGEKVSSTIIRQLIEQGEMAHAARMLCHPYLVIADIDAGEVRITDPYKLLPPAGCYEALVEGEPARLTVPEEGLPYLAGGDTRKDVHIEITARC